MRVLALAMLLSVAPAVAKPAESIVVVGAGACDAPALAGHVRAVRQALERRLGSAVLSEPETFAALGGLPRGTLASAAVILGEVQENLLSDARMSRAENLEREKRTEEKLRRATEVLLSLPPSLERSQTLLRAIALELQLYSDVDKQSKLEKTLESILRPLPNYRFDPNVYSPPQLAQYEKARKRVHEKSTASLRVTSRAAGVAVYVDGFEVGTAPVALALPPGKYRVEAASGASRGIAHTVVVAGRAEVDIDADLERSIQLGGGPCVEGTTPEGRSARLVRLAALLRVQLLVTVDAKMVGDRESHLEVELVEGTSGMRRSGAAVRLLGGAPAPAGLDQLWSVLERPKQAAQADLSPPHSKLLVPVPPPARRPPGWMRPCAYVAGGLAIGLAGLAVYEGVSSRGFDKKANSLLEPGGTVSSPSDRVAYTRARDEADTRRRAMYVSAGAAAALAGAAGILGYLSREPEPFVIRF